MVSSAEQCQRGDLLFQSLKLAGEFSEPPTQCNGHILVEVVCGLFSIESLN